MAEEFDVQDYAASMQEIGKRFDNVDRAIGEQTRQLVFQNQQLTELNKKFDDQDIALYNLSAIMERHSRDIRDIRGEVRNINGKIDQVIALLTQKQGE